MHWLPPLIVRRWYTSSGTRSTFWLRRTLNRGNLHGQDARGNPLEISWKAGSRFSSYQEEKFFDDRDEGPAEKKLAGETNDAESRHD
jgi:hypothetical protein